MTCRSFSGSSRIAIKSWISSADPVFVDEFFLLETGQAVQAHIEDRLRLDLDS